MALGQLFAQKLVLDGSWKGLSVYDEKKNSGKGLPTELITGIAPVPENSVFKDVNFDDNNWKTLDAINSLKLGDNVIKEKVFWLRKTFFIGDDYKKLLNANGAISLHLKGFGLPVCYLNGVDIGKQVKEDGEEREILLKTDLIKWNANNTLAIRLSYSLSLNGKEFPFVTQASSDLLFVFENRKESNSTFFIQNRSAKEVYATLETTYYRFDNTFIIKNSARNILLNSGINHIEIDFPTTTGYIKAKCSLNIPVYQLTKEWYLSKGIDSIVYHPKKAAFKSEIPLKYESLPWNNQKIQGWLGERLQLNTTVRLENVDVDGLIGGYLNQPGVHPWIGEHAGKFLDAACNAYNYKHNARLKLMIDKVAQNVIASQKEDGYLGTYVLDKHWTSWDVWSHKYNLVGLMNYYQTSGYQPALTACKRIGDLLCKTFGNNPGQLDLINSGTHVGMAATSVLDPMVDLYQLTEEQKYLDFCKYILRAYDQANGPKIISTLKATGRVDKVANAKAYEMLSNFVGIVKFSKVTGDEELLDFMQNAWADIVKNRMYITGTASSYEMFQDDHNLPAAPDDHMGEGCVTTTWMQFNYQLFQITGNIKYLDELERTALNHATGAENPHTGCVSYYTSLMGAKPYGCNITCCLSSVPRGISMIPLFTNGMMDKKPVFLLYQSGTLTTDVNGKEIQFSTESGFPVEGNAKIMVTTSSPVNLPVLFRKPYWAKDFVLKVNGKAVKAEGQDCVTVQRTWNNNDKIEISCNIPLIKLDGGKSYPDCVALQKGSRVLSLDKQLNNIDAKDVVLPSDIQLTSDSSTLPKDWIGGCAFSTTVQVHGKSEKLIFVPFADAGQNGSEVTTWLKK